MGDATTEFDRAAKMSKSSATRDIAVAATSRSGPDTPEHRRFRKLLAQIDAARERLAAWQQHLPAFASAYAAQVEPVQRRMAAQRRAWVFELEHLLLSSKWTRPEAATLTRLILELAAAGLDDNEADAELLALHDRHAELDHASGQQQGLAEMKAMFEQVAGLNLGDDPIGSPEELLQRAQAQMAEMAEKHRLHAEQQQQAPAQHQRGRKKTKPSAAQTRAEEEASRAKQTVREVYRKLAAVLHPDRAEPGATREQQAQRHEQMARANAAYEAGDLLALLSLQLQVEQVDIAHAANVAADQVRYFNKVLAEQLREIEDEINDREHTFLGSYGIPPMQRPQPNKLGSVLKQELVHALADEASLASDRRKLGGEPALAKRFLKDLAAQYRMEDQMEDWPPF